VLLTNIYPTSLSVIFDMENMVSRTNLFSYSEQTRMITININSGNAVPLLYISL